LDDEWDRWKVGMRLRGFCLLRQSLLQFCRWAGDQWDEFLNIAPKIEGVGRRGNARGAEVLYIMMGGAREASALAHLCARIIISSMHARIDRLSVKTLARYG